MKLYVRLIGLLLIAPVTLAAESDLYLRVASGINYSADTTIRDVNSEAVDPPALFGSDQTTANGDFDDSAVYELALGYQVLPNVRAELVYADAPGFEFRGNARFFGVGDQQPTSAKAEASSLFIAAYYDFPALQLGAGSIRAVRPYIGAGLGRSETEIDRVLYQFPQRDIGANGELPFSLSPGGESDGSSFFLTLGLGVELTESLLLDLSYKYTDYGDVETDSGPLRVVRYDDAGQIVLDIDVQIAPTVAELKGNAALIGLRWRF